MIVLKKKKWFLFLPFKSWQQKVEKKAGDPESNQQLDV